jgi:hypothetical protein
MFTRGEGRRTVTAYVDVFQVLAHLLLDQPPDEQSEQQDQTQGFDPGQGLEED